jgi:hypothetical protein
MNNQFDNFNSQFNNQPPVSNGENPIQLPKRKFFTSNIIDEPNFDDVGGTTSGSVVSWNTSSNMPKNNRDTFTNQNNMTGAVAPGFGAFEQGPSNQVQQPNTMENPPQPEMNMALSPTVQEAMPTKEIQTNAMGMALAEPVTEKQPETKKDESIEMLSEINGDVYVDNEPEVLDFEPKDEEVKKPSNSIRDKYIEEQKFQEDQLSQGNFANLMGNSGGTTFAPGMSKEEAPKTLNEGIQQPQPVQPIQQPQPVQPIQQPQPVQQPQESQVKLNAMPKPDLGIVPTPVVPPQVPAVGLAATPIFQAATEAVDSGNTQNQANPQLQNQKVESWMANQPLSGENFKPEQNVDVNNYSGVVENKKVEIFNKKDKKKKKQETEPVPEEVIKKDEGKIRVDNMANAIVGSKYQEFVMSPFNFAALFFGPTYMAYRRMPLAAIVVYAIQIVVVFFLPTLAPDEYYLFAQLGATLGFALLFALGVNRMILANAKFKAKSIVKKYGEDGPKDKAMIMAQRMGKPSIIMALLFLVLSGAVTGLLLTTVFKNTKLANIYNIYMDAYQNGEKVNYNGVIIHSDYDVSNIVSLEVPEGFTKIDNMKYTFITEESATNNDCSFEIYAVDKYTSGDTFIKDMARFNNDSKKVTNKEINGIDWTNYYTEDSLYKVFYRGFTYKNHALVFEYKSGKKASDGVCDQLYVQVMDGISIKES